MTQVCAQALDKQRRELDLPNDGVAAAAQKTAHTTRRVAVVHDQGTSGRVAQEAVAVPVSYTHLDVYKRQLQLNPAGLKRHRQRAGLTPSQVAAMLAARGWDITQRDIFRWENQSSADVPPAVIEALAQVVRATTEDLTSITTP